MKPQNYKLSQNFTLYEYVEGYIMPKEARDMNWKAWNETLEKAVKDNIHHLQEIRDWVQEKFKEKNNGNPIPIIITAGFRCKEWELKQRGKDTSQHTICAFDFTAFAKDTALSIEINKAVYDYIHNKKWMGGLAIKHPSNGTTGFIHIDFRTPTSEHIRRGYGARWVY